MSGKHWQIMQVIGDLHQGGDGRMARNIASALRRDGMNAYCVALRSSTCGHDSHPNDVPLGVGNGFTAGLSGIRRFRRLIKARRPDVIHVHGPSSLVLAAAAVRTVAQPPRLWFTWHAPGAVDGAERLSFHWAAARCEHLFGSSSDVCKRLSQALGGRGVDVFRNGTPSLPCSSSVVDAIPTISWAARIDPVKNPQVMIRAASQLRREGLQFRLILAGGANTRCGWLDQELRAWVRKHQLSEVVTFAGWMPNVEDLWGQSSIGVQSSSAEGLSMTLLEQCMAGLAIVATDVGDTSAIIKHESTGLLVPPGNVEALTDALRRVIRDRSLRQRLGSAARSLAMDRFGLDQMARQVRTRL